MNEGKIEVSLRAALIARNVLRRAVLRGTSTILAWAENLVKYPYN